MNNNNNNNYNNNKYHFDKSEMKISYDSSHDMTELEI